VLGRIAFLSRRHLHALAEAVYDQADQQDRTGIPSQLGRFIVSSDCHSGAMRASNPESRDSGFGLSAAPE
jgi:hypothetical protein